MQASIDLVEPERRIKPHAGARSSALAAKTSPALIAALDLPTEERWETTYVLPGRAMMILSFASTCIARQAAR
jgi:hypothetical protein